MKTSEEEWREGERIRVGKEETRGRGGKQSKEARRKETGVSIGENIGGQNVEKNIDRVDKIILGELKRK